MNWGLKINDLDAITDAVMGANLGIPGNGNELRLTIARHRRRPQRFTGLAGKERRDQQLCETSRKSLVASTGRSTAR
jgi:hypothetical protein